MKFCKVCQYQEGFFVWGGDTINIRGSGGYNRMGKKGLGESRCQFAVPVGYFIFFIF